MKDNGAMDDNDLATLRSLKSTDENEVLVTVDTDVCIWCGDLDIYIASQRGHTVQIQGDVARAVLAKLNKVDLDALEAAWRRYEDRLNNSTK